MLQDPLERWETGEGVYEVAASVGAPCPLESGSKVCARLKTAQDWDGDTWVLDEERVVVEHVAGDRVFVAAGPDRVRALDAVARYAAWHEGLVFDMAFQASGEDEPRIIGPIYSSGGRIPELAEVRTFFFHR